MYNRELMIQIDWEGDVGLVFFSDVKMGKCK